MAEEWKSPDGWTVENVYGESLNLSVSAAETFVECPRKWYRGYFQRVRSAGKAATIAGGKIHELAEQWLAKEEDPNSELYLRWWRYFEPAIAYVPGGRELNWQIESALGGWAGPLPFKGFADLWTVLEEDLHLPDEGVTLLAGDLLVGDWKTTSHSKDWRYAKSPYQLKEFRQPKWYTERIVKEKLGGTIPNRTHFFHINIASTGKPKAMITWAFSEDIKGPIRGVPKVQPPEVWDEAVDIATRMAEAVEAACGDWTKVDGNINHCKAYGGCDYAEHCPLSPMNRYEKEQPHYEGTAPIPQETLMSNNNQVNDIRAMLGLGASAPAPAPAPCQQRSRPACGGSTPG